MADPETPSDFSRLAPRTPAKGAVLAFDFGEKRIGVAVGDFELRMAHPIGTIAAEDNATRFAEIGKLVAEWNPVMLVVGLPMHGDGAEHEMSRLARRFANRLEGRFGVEVTLVDERLTSVAAESRLREAGARGDKVKAALDAAAASEILAAYFAAP